MQFPILIENIGALANLSRVQMDQMKSAVYMGAQIKTQEVFIHGTTGRNCKFKQFMEISAKSR